jgi:hypothetical protein
MSSFSKRMKRLRRLAGEHEKPVPDVAVVPYVAPAETVEAGLKRLNLPALLEDLTHLEPPPPSGSFSTYEDVGGAAMVGPTDVIEEQVRRFQVEGAEHVVFDLRPCLEDWEEQLTVLGEQLLPQLRAGDASSTNVPGEVKSA